MVSQTNTATAQTTLKRYHVCRPDHNAKRFVCSLSNASVSPLKGNNGPTGRVETKCHSKEKRSGTKQKTKLNQQPHKFRMQLDEEIR
jgi:hypothetical protein